MCSSDLTDAKGNFIKKPNGRYEKVLRYGGDLNKYYNIQFQNPLACWIKWDDSIEGTSTRILEDIFERAPEEAFSLSKNIEYASERRAIYGRRANVEVAKKMWPDFADVLQSADSMLGKNLVILESFNDYAKDDNLNPKNAMPIKTAQYNDEAWDGYQFVPSAWRPERIQTERIEKIAQKNPRWRAFLDHVVYPSMDTFRADKINPYLIDEDLQNPAYSVPNMA